MAWNVTIYDKSALNTYINTANGMVSNIYTTPDFEAVSHIFTEKTKTEATREENEVPASAVQIISELKSDLYGFP